MWKPFVKNKTIMDRVRASDFVKRLGHISNLEGLVIEAKGPDAFLGELCAISSAGHEKLVPAEVIGLRENKTILMPIGTSRGLKVGDCVTASGRYLEVPVGDWLIGRVLDGLGRPVDDLPVPLDTQWASLHAKVCSPLDRAPIHEVVSTGVKAIDAFMPLGRGQRIGIFAGSGVGKSTLISMIIRNLEADVVVLALVGERGREVQEFVSHLQAHARSKRFVVISATSDQPALVRVHAAHTALTICEYFCNQGMHVGFIMDSITRFAMAQREIGISAGEPPSARGYTPSVFDALPKLVERCGNFKNKGSITGVITVLVEGDDMNDPIADSVRSLLDGSIVMSRSLANQGHYPAIDVLASNSRLFHQLTEPDVRKMVSIAVTALSTYQMHKEVIELGVYKSGSNSEIEHAIASNKALTDFLCQEVTQVVDRNQTIKALNAIVSAK
jgi:flagellum-specific ATP synthase